jgi:hypothetical protein
MRRVYTEAELKKKRRGRCICEGCSKKSQKRSPLCYKHAKRQWAEKHTAHYKFANLRTNAKRRKKDFTITREWFMEKVKDSGYIENSGRHAQDLSIDRPDNWRGYHEDNFRVVTVHYNSVKGARDEAEIEAPF